MEALTERRRRPHGRSSGGALVFVGFMGAGKSSAARSVAAELGVEPVDSDRELEAELGETDRVVLRPRGRARVPRARGGGGAGLLGRAGRGVVALGGGALESERVRDALRGHTVVHLEVDPRTPGGARREGAGRWPATAAASTSSTPTATALRVRRPRDDPARGPRRRAACAAGAARATRRARPVPRTAHGLGESRSGDYPVFFGRGPSPPALPSRRTGGVRRHRPPRRRAPPRRRRATVAIGPGRRQDPGHGRDVLSSLARAGAGRGDLIVAVGGGVVGDLAGLLRRRLPARHAPRPGADDAGGPGRFGLRRQDRGGPARGQELRGRPITSRPRWCATRRARDAAGRRAGRRLRRGRQDGADRRRAAVVARARRRPGRRGGHPRLPAHEAGCCGRRRARRRPAPGAQPRAHRRPRVEAATAYTRYRHGEAVGIGLLAALRLSGRDALRRRWRGCWPHRAFRSPSRAPASRMSSP